MAMSSSEIVVIPKRFSGIRVLLIEPEHTSLVQHAYMLSQNSYRVTSTATASTGLTMIQNGHLYDCVLVDVDTREMDMVDFIHQVLKRKPELSIIIMVSDDRHMMRFVNEALKNEAILCLVKPCELSDICNIWNHVCRKKIASEKHDSKGKSHQASNIIGRFDPIFKKFATLNRAMSNNETSQEDGAMFNPVYMDSFGNEVGTGTIRNTEKGKQPTDNDQPLEGDTYEKKRINKPRINWTKALHGKFLEALNTLGKQNSIPSEILKYMNVPGLTRNHVASHLQKLIGGERISKRPRLVPVVEIGDNLQAGSFASKTSGQLTLSNYNHGSIIQPNSLQTPSRSLNSAGLSYMSLANIKARMQESPLAIPTPRPATTTMSNFGGDQVTDHSSRVTFPLSMSDHQTSMINSPTLGLVQNFGSIEAVLAQSGVGPTVAPDNPTGLFGATNLSNGFDNGNSGGAIEAQTPFSFHGGNLLDGEPRGLFGTENRNLGGSSVTEHPFAVPFSFDNRNNSRVAISSGVSEALTPSFHNGNSGGGGFGTQVLTPLRYDTYDSSLDDAIEPLAEFDCFGIPIDPWPVTEMGSEDHHGLGDPFEPLVGLDEEKCNDIGASETTAILSPITESQTQTDGGDIETSVTNDQSLEDLALHEFVSHELGGLCDYPQDLQGNGGDLFMGFLDDSATQPEIPPPAVNSNVVSCLDGGVEEATTGGIDDDPLIVHMTQFDVERTMQLLDEVDSSDLINP